MKAILSICVHLAIIYGVLGSKKAHEDDEPKLTLVGCFLQIVAGIYFIFALGATCGLVVAMSWKNFFGVLLILTCPLISIIIINLKHQLFSGFTLQLINNINLYFYGTAPPNKLAAFDKKLARLNKKSDNVKILTKQLLNSATYSLSIQLAHEKIHKAHKLKKKLGVVIAKHEKAQTWFGRKKDSQYFVKNVEVNLKALKNTLKNLNDFVLVVQKQIQVQELQEQSNGLWRIYETTSEEEFWMQYRKIIFTIQQETPAYISTNND